jgi:high-affinity iron transporter
VLLLIFAAGLLAHGVHEFQEAGLLPTANPQLWDVNHILSEDSIGGELLKSLAGYNGNPSLEEVIAYVLYWIFALLGIRWLVERSLEGRRRSGMAG